jgi:cytochrome P450
VSTSVASASADAATTAAAHFARTRGELDALLAEELSHRRDHPDAARSDVLALMMESRDDAGCPLSDDELRDQLVTLLSAGHDTVATSLAWGLLELDAHPEVRARLHQEIDALGPEPDPEALARLPYLGAVVNEMLRLHPVVAAVSRQVMKPFRVAGYELEPGARVTPAIYLAHRRAEAFPTPDRFRPERFFERDPSPFEFLPFGGGARRCIGMGFALHEMRIVLGTILSEVELRSAMRGPVREVRHVLLVAPSEGARMIVRRRGSLSQNDTDDQEGACGIWS